MTAEIFTAAAQRCRGRVTKIAEDLGTTRRQVYRWAEKFGVELESLRG